MWLLKDMAHLDFNIGLVRRWFLAAMNSTGDVHSVLFIIQVNVENRHSCDQLAVAKTRYIW